MAWSGPVRMNEQAELPHGTLLDGRFRVHSLLGEGGMGCVYLATDLEHGHDVALKILIPQYRGRADREQRLLNEAAFARRVGDHPALPKLHDSGRLQDLDGCPYVAWEVARGSDLNGVLLSRRRIAPRVAAQWARQLADALCAMHRAGVVHRDVTVTNVFIESPDGDARVKLIDLSHAAFVPEPGAPSRRLTREFEIPGAHRFMPPEQTLAHAPDPKMDVFSFGVVLHEMLTGRNPFDHVRDRETYIEMQRAGQLHVPRIDRRGYPEVSEALVELVERCTDNDIGSRLDMTEVLQRLDEEIASIPVVLVADEPEDATDAPTPASPGDPRAVAVVQEHADAVPHVEERTEPVTEQPPITREIIDSDSTATELPLEDRPRSLVTIIAVALVTVVIVGAVAFVLLWPEGMDTAAPTPTVPDEASTPNEVDETLPAVDLEPERPTSPTPVEEAEPEEPEPVQAEEPAATDLEPQAPEVEPKPTRPQPAEPSKRKPPKGERTAPAAVKTPAYESDECRSKVAAAQSAEADGAWLRLELLTRKRKCFEDRNLWAKLRTHALLETGRFAECAALADDFQDPFVQKYARTCRAQQDRQ